MTKQDIRNLKAQKDFFVGIDSDGCAFPTMELKHKECFIPNTVRYWKLQPVSRYAREAAEFVNLYSRFRGENRFPALLKVFDLLAGRPEVLASGLKLPEVPALRRWVAASPSLANPALKQEIEREHHPDLVRALQWSEAVNASVAEMVVDVPPFPGVRQALERMAERADLMVVSSTPGDALQREWSEHGLAGYPRLVAGQELGRKEQHLELAAGGKYPGDRILMIGDAPGDNQAARAAGAHFFPIMPGKEESSWSLLLEEALELFFSGRYAGRYEQSLVDEFNSLLPESPPWCSA